MNIIIGIKKKIGELLQDNLCSLTELAQFHCIPWKINTFSTPKKKKKIEDNIRCQFLEKGQKI